MIDPNTLDILRNDLFALSVARPIELDIFATSSSPPHPRVKKNNSDQMTEHVGNVTMVTAAKGTDISTEPSAARLGAPVERTSSIVDSPNIARSTNRAISSADASGRERTPRVVPRRYALRNSLFFLVAPTHFTVAIVRWRQT